MLQTTYLFTLLTLAWSCANAFLSARPRCPSSRSSASSSSNGIITRLVDHESSSVPTLVDSAPSWSTIQQLLTDTDIGKQLYSLQQEQSRGRGPPSVDAHLRLFDETDEANIRVTLYRDSAAWCPYTQKVWIVLEELKIPYKIKTVPLNAYGDKPVWYTQLVNGGKLPSIELDGAIHVESLDIMKLLYETFERKEQHDSFSLPQEVLDLEKRIQRDWFSLVFYPVQDEALEKAQHAFLDTMQEMDEKLGTTPGPWFAGNDTPSCADILYIPMMERINASILYWRNMTLNGRFPNIDLWLQAWEERPSYTFSKSDYYTLCLAIPSQNGPGYFSPQAVDIAAQIYGLDGAWDLRNAYSMPLLEPVHIDDTAARREAVFRVVNNHDDIAMFCARAAGEPGRPAFHAELADPYAIPNEDFIPAIDVCLRHVAHALLKGSTEPLVQDAAADSLRGGLCTNTKLMEGWEAYEERGRTYYWNQDTGDVAWTPPTGQLDACLAYLRDRVGVPRDMSYPAARQLRMHLNWAIAILHNE